MLQKTTNLWIKGGRNSKKSYTILHDLAQIGKINEKKTHLKDLLLVNSFECIVTQCSNL